MTTIDGIRKLFKVRFSEEGSKCQDKRAKCLYDVHYLDCEKGESFAMNTLITTYLMPVL